MPKKWPAQRKGAKHFDYGPGFYTATGRGEDMYPGGPRPRWSLGNLKRDAKLKRQQKRLSKKYERGSKDDIYADTGRLFGKNPVQLLFKTRAAALKYAREHGAKRFSIKKLKRGR
jgi:hypothetical protein